jgi:hypothetical protein
VNIVRFSRAGRHRRRAARGGLQTFRRPRIAAPPDTAYLALTGTELAGALGLLTHLAFDVGGLGAAGTIAPSRHAKTETASTTPFRVANGTCRQ